MEVHCPKCQQTVVIRRKIGDSDKLVTNCPTCDTAFLVKRKPKATWSETSPQPKAPGADTQPRASWHVRKEDGTVLSFENIRTLQTWVLAGVVSLDDEISRSRKKWKRLSDLPELAGFIEKMHHMQQNEATPDSGVRFAGPATLTASQSEFAGVDPHPTEPSLRPARETTRTVSREVLAGANLSPTPLPPPVRSRPTGSFTTTGIERTTSGILLEERPRKRAPFAALAAAAAVAVAAVIVIVMLRHDTQDSTRRVVTVAPDTAATEGQQGVQVASDEPTSPPAAPTGTGTAPRLAAQSAAAKGPEGTAPAGAQPTPGAATVASLTPTGAGGGATATGEDRQPTATAAPAGTVSSATESGSEPKALQATAEPEKAQEGSVAEEEAQTSAESEQAATSTASPGEADTAKETESKKAGSQGDEKPASEAVADASTTRRRPTRKPSGSEKKRDEVFRERASGASEWPPLDSYDSLMKRAKRIERESPHLALTFYLKASQSSPGRVEPVARSGWCHLRTGNTRMALHYFNKAVKMNPRYVDSYKGLARTYVKMGNAGEACKQYRTYISRVPPTSSWHQKALDAMAKIDCRP